MLRFSRILFRVSLPHVTSKNAVLPQTAQAALDVAMKQGNFQRKIWYTLGARLRHPLKAGEESKGVEVDGVMYFNIEQFNFNHAPTHTTLQGMELPESAQPLLDAAMIKGKFSRPKWYPRKPSYVLKQGEEGNGIDIDGTVYYNHDQFIWNDDRQQQDRTPMLEISNSVVSVTPEIQALLDSVKVDLGAGSDRWRVVLPSDTFEMPKDYQGATLPLGTLRKLFAGVAALDEGEFENMSDQTKVTLAQRNALRARKPPTNPKGVPFGAETTAILQKVAAERGFTDTFWSAESQLNSYFTIIPGEKDKGVTIIEGIPPLYNGSQTQLKLGVNVEMDGTPFEKSAQAAFDKLIQARQAQRNLPQFKSNKWVTLSQLPADHVVKEEEEANGVKLGKKVYYNLSQTKFVHLIDGRSFDKMTPEFKKLQGEMRNSPTAYSSRVWHRDAKGKEGHMLKPGAKAHFVEGIGALYHDEQFIPITKGAKQQLEEEPAFVRIT